MSDLGCTKVAQQFGFKRRTVLKWATRGILPGTLTTRGWRFDPAVVAAFTPPRQVARNRGCSTAGCVRPHHALGLCKPEYKRAARRQVPRVFDLDDSGEL